MRPMLLMQILILVAALVGVFYVMHHLNQGVVDQAFQSVGAQGGASDSEATESTFNLCRTRVVAIHWPDGRRIEESKDGLKVLWLSFDPDRRGLNSVEIERWFSRHCEFKGTKLTGKAAPQVAPKGPTWVIEYVDGSSAKLEKISDDIYSLDGVEFRSKELSGALEELEQAAQFSKSLSA